MVRVGGMTYTCAPAAIGKRISEMGLAGKPIEADKNYKVAGWAPARRRASRSGTCLRSICAREKCRVSAVAALC